jgi:hypothetical protein
VVSSRKATIHCGRVVEMPDRGIPAADLRNTSHAIGRRARAGWEIESTLPTY